MGCGPGPNHTAIFGSGTKVASTFSAPGTSTRDSCPFCKIPHALHPCEEFRKLKRSCFRCFVISELKVLISADCFTILLFPLPFCFVFPYLPKLCNFFGRYPPCL